VQGSFGAKGASQDDNFYLMGDVVEELREEENSVFGDADY
jgi:hypothetical protein